MKLLTSSLMLVTLLASHVYADNNEPMSFPFSNATDSNLTVVCSSGYSSCPATVNAAGVASYSLTPSTNNSTTVTFTDNKGVTACLLPVEMNQRCYPNPLGCSHWLYVDPNAVQSGPNYACNVSGSPSNGYTVTLTLLSK